VLLNFPSGDRGFRRIEEEKNWLRGVRGFEGFGDGLCNCEKGYDWDGWIEAED